MSFRIYVLVFLLALPFFSYGWNPAVFELNRGWIVTRIQTINHPINWRIGEAGGPVSTYQMENLLAEAVATDIAADTQATQRHHNFHLLYAALSDMYSYRGTGDVGIASYKVYNYFQVDLMIISDEYSISQSKANELLEMIHKEIEARKIDWGSDRKVELIAAPEAGKLFYKGHPNLNEIVQFAL